MKIDFYKALLQAITMKSAKQAISTVFQLDRCGGTLIQRDHYTLILTDYDHLYSTAIVMLIEQFPGLEVTTQQSDSSASGFIIIFSFPPQAPWHQRSETIQLILSALLLIAVATWTISAHS